MTADLNFDPAPTRPIWLITLADLALLLVGTLVLFQALSHQRPDAVAAGIRQGFAGNGTPQPATPVPPMPVAAAALDGFGTASATSLASTAPLARWALDAARDPRITLLITGETDGSAADVDPRTGSAALLAADRARTVLFALVAAGVPAQRLELSAHSGRARAVTVTLAFAGETR